MVKHATYILLLILETGFCLKAKNVNPLIINSESNSYALLDHVTIFSDSKGISLKEFKQVDKSTLIRSDQFEDKGNIKFIWGYFDIENSNKEVVNWWINFANNDYTTVFFEGKEYSTGYLVKGSEKPIIPGSYYVPVTLLPGKMYRVYFKLEKDFHKYNFKFKIDNAKDRVNSLWYKKLWAMFLQGIFAIMFMYGLLVYLRLKEKVYLFYSLYLGSTAVFYLFVDSLLREYLIPELPKLSYLGVIALYPSAIFYFHFLRNFIDIKNLHQWIRFLITKALWFSYVLTATALITYLTGNEQYLEIISQIFIILNASIALITIAHLAFSRNAMGRWLNFFAAFGYCRCAFLGQ